MAKKRRVPSDAKLRSGARRAAHFSDNGGDAAGWRGRAAVFTDRKKEADRKACRRKVGW